MKVGVIELKQHLSKYINKVEKGQIIQVTDRGRPKAIITPVPPSNLLNQGIAQGYG